MLEPHEFRCQFTKISLIYKFPIANNLRIIVGKYLRDMKSGYSIYKWTRTTQTKSGADTHTSLFDGVKQQKSFSPFPSLCI